ncbi:septin and tuftelin-interacting protein 1 homolog 1-like [Lolium perenne]|uniref:septin and tuftelin-interacting protein 1 homolog 1-like n=1 Tax=Lolium perenne TaxID=4522 RepID=UPI0021EA19CD|nr:septin and tuftelin-interacting protein 1 homolog 1-like [Lolium perenne]
MGSDAGSDAFRGKRRREEPHQFLSSAGQGTTSKRRKPDSTGDDGSMESKYGAAASRMMANMGFKPGTGLGKDGQGIVAPLEGVSRPAHAGLGSVQEHRPFFHGKENLPPPPPALAEEEQEPPRWSRKAGAARKSPAPVLVLSKSALLTTRAEQDEQVQPMVVDRVIDMRGPEPRVLTDLTGLNDEQEMEVDEDRPMPELQYNLRVLVDQAAAGIRCLDEQLQREKEDVAGLMREKNRLAEQEASHGHELRVMEAITGALEQVRADEAAGVLTPEALLDTFRELKTRHEEVFDLCGLAWIACEFVRPLLVRAFHGWQPLHDPSFGLEVMSPWKDFLLQQQQRRYDFSSDCTDPYAQLVHEVILPVVRASGTNSWDARDPEPMLRFLESWEELLPPAVLESTLQDVIMPKLTAAIDSWDRENVPIHAWVHPWLPILGQTRTETLCHSVRYKLSTGILRSWQSHDASAYAALSPWKGVFDPASWEAMITRYIVPKLKLALQELQVSPAVNSQEPEQFNDQLMIWASATSASHMIHLLEVEFFSKWLLVLYHWLRSTDPNFDEVVYWYKSWRGILPPELIAHRRVRMLLAAGLVMMDNAAEGREVLPPGAAREAVGCPEAAEDRQFDAAQGAPQQVPGGAAMEDLSFKDRILAYAEGHGLKFTPRPGKFYNGVPVYEFGCVRVCLDSVKGLLYAQDQGSWSSVTLAQLMEMNRMATPC